MTPSPSLSDEEVRARIAAVPHWYHQITIRPGIVTPGINASAGTLAQLALPEDCTGLRVLDIGARDGYFSFEFERRGADVVAIDYMEPGETGFPVARELLGSRVEFRVDNVYDLHPSRHGEFDIVLFLGVLYHLRDPLLALDRIWEVCRPGALLALETQVLEDAVLLPDGEFRALGELHPLLEEIPLAQFHPGDVLRGDATNYWSPNGPCMRGLLQSAGFEVTGEAIDGSRGVFHGRRVDDASVNYHRRLEKGVVREVTPARPAASEEPTPAGELERLRSEVASLQYRRHATDDELAGARRYIASLEATLDRKDRELQEAIDYQQAVAAPAPPGPPAGLLRRAAAVLDRRRR